MIIREADRKSDHRGFSRPLWPSLVSDAMISTFRSVFLKVPAKPSSRAGRLNRLPALASIRVVGDADPDRQINRTEATRSLSSENERSSSAYDPPSARLLGYPRRIPQQLEANVRIRILANDTAIDIHRIA